MSTGLIHLLRVVHVLAGSFWFGAALLNTGFLAPTVRAIGPAAGGQFMRHIVQERKLPVFINGSAVLTVLSGLALYWWRSSGFDSTWVSSNSGLLFGFGGIVAIVALFFGVLVIGRAAGRLGVLAAEAQSSGGAPTPELAAEIQRLQARMSTGSKIGLALVTVATLCMAVGRYV
jgi:hypothetical protein